MPVQPSHAAGGNREPTPHPDGTDAYHTRRQGPGLLPPVLLAAAVTILVGMVFGLVLTARSGNDQPGTGEPGPDGDDGGVRSTVMLGQGGDSLTASVSLLVDAEVLQLSVPERSGLVAGFAPTISDLRVTVEGQDAAIDDVLSVGEAGSVSLPGGPAQVTVVYSSTGVVSQSPSRAGRGLVLLTPLRLHTGAEQQRTVEVTDPRVLNLGCVEGQVMTACGRDTGAGWEVETDGGAVDVLAQVDLDR